MPNSLTGAALDLVNVVRVAKVMDAPGALALQTPPPPCAIRWWSSLPVATHVPFLSLAIRIRVGRGFRRFAMCRSVRLCGTVDVEQLLLVLLSARAAFDADPPPLAGGFA